MIQRTPKNEVPHKGAPEGGETTLSTPEGIIGLLEVKGQHVTQDDRTWLPILYEQLSKEEMVKKPAMKDYVRLIEETMREIADKEDSVAQLQSLKEKLLSIGR